MFRYERRSHQMATNLQEAITNDFVCIPFDLKLHLRNINSKHNPHLSSEAKFFDAVLILRLEFHFRFTFDSLFILKWISLLLDRTSNVPYTISLFKYYFQSTIVKSHGTKDRPFAYNIVYMLIGMKMFGNRNDFDWNISIVNVLDAKHLKEFFYHIFRKQRQKWLTRLIAYMPKDSFKIENLVMLKRIAWQINFRYIIHTLHEQFYTNFKYYFFPTMATNIFTTHSFLQHISSPKIFNDNLTFEKEEKKT